MIINVRLLDIEGAFRLEKKKLKRKQLLNDTK